VKDFGEEEDKEKVNDRANSEEENGEEEAVVNEVQIEGRAIMHITNHESYRMNETGEDVSSVEERYSNPNCSF